MEQENKKRPTFLTVLCILTFVGSGLGILFSILGMILYTGMITESYDSYSEFDSLSPGLSSELAEMAAWTLYSNLTGVLAGLLCLGGALLMWNRLKAGYFLYGFGWLLSIIMSILMFAFVTVEYVRDETTVIMSIVMLGLNFILMVGFMVMYGVNLKHMK
jgi:hypothetical protein